MVLTRVIDAEVLTMQHAYAALLTQWHRTASAKHVLQVETNEAVDGDPAPGECIDEELMV